MNYPQLVALMVVVALLVAVFALRALPPARRSAHLVATLATSVALAFLAAVFDSLMIRAGLFTFAADKISGLAVGLAPIEDLIYAVACGLALPAVWVLVRRRRDGD
jgi:lycopene cyclase domain-containing protein